MITPIGSTTRHGRRARALAVPLLAAGLLAALAAGCGTAQVSSASGQQRSGSTPPGKTASGVVTPGGPESTAPAPSATPVPTVSGGPVPAGQPACAGWPTKAPTASLPVSFVPVSVERCVNGAQTIPGKGLWATATLQRADHGLTALINALHRPPTGPKSGAACPALAMIPPQIVLTNAHGEQLIPRIPVTGCGLTQSQVLAALNTLSWQPLSVRLISPLPNGTAPTVSASPRAYQTVGGVQPQ
jgi:hypothetical protein